MKRKFVFLIIALFGVLFSASAREILIMKDGSVLKGEFVEATGEQVKFRTDDDTVRVYEMDKVASLAEERLKNFSTKGYRSQIEQVAECGSFWAFGYDIILGYQFNSHLQLGAGAGFRFLGSMYSDRSVPLHIDFKVNILKTKVTPFLDFKGGAMMFVDEKIGSSSFYLSPSVGIKKHYSEARALSFSAGWTVARNHEDVCSGCSGDGDDAFFNGGAFSFKVNYQF